MTETKQNLTRLRATRRGHRGFCTKLENEVLQLLEEDTEDISRCETIRELLDTKLKLLDKIDEEILTLCDIDVIEDEIEESCEVTSRIINTRKKLELFLKKPANNENNDKGTTSATIASTTSTTTTSTNPSLSHTNAIPTSSGFGATNTTSSTIPSSSYTNAIPTSSGFGATNTTSSTISSLSYTTANAIPSISGFSATNTTSMIPSSSYTNAIPTISGFGATNTTSSTISSPPTSNATIGATIANSPKLPKLILNKFKGDVTKWNSFWDSFNSTIHNNNNIAKIDKFNYLISLLEGTALRSIEGLSMTNANYDHAIDILRDRFGKPQQIIAAHMDEILKIPSCTGERTANLRFVYDKISVHVRGLASLGVSSEQYGSLLIPIIMSKLPNEIRLLIARKSSSEVWKIDDLLDTIKTEIEAREVSEATSASSVNTKPAPGNRQLNKPTATTLVSRDQRDNGFKIQCVFCEGQHYSASCEKFSDFETRKRMLRDSGRCYICLRKNHQAKNCRNNKKCRRCQSTTHHQSICDKNNSHATAGNDSNTTNSQQVVTTTTTTSLKAKGEVLLQTASVIAINENGSTSLKVKVLFDTGSQRSYVTNHLKSKLGLNPIKTETINLNTFGSNKSTKQRCDVLSLRLIDKNNEIIQMSVLGSQSICSPLSTSIDTRDYPHLQGLTLASSSDTPDHIDVLIGSDYYWNIVSSEIVQGDYGPTAINSKLGWLVSGPTDCSPTSKTVVTNLCLSGGPDELLSQDPLVDTLKQFWQVESVGVEEVSNVQELRELFDDQIRFNGERYEVNLPWKETRHEITNDYGLCQNRLSSLQRRLIREQVYLREYNQIIQEQLQNGIVEVVPEDEVKKGKGECVHYLPHHAVIRRDRETTKLRIVYDGSAKPSDRSHSLNDCLETGPNYTPQLFDMLVKFRWHKVALTADIEKAFLMVAIEPSDRDMLRFLWLKNPNDPNSEVLHLRFTRLVFGLRPSPAILGSTIRHHLDNQNPNDSDLEVINLLKNSLYVDDLVCGTENEYDAVEIYTSAKTIMNRGGFNLRKWNTNSSKVRELITSSDEKLVSCPTTEDDESYAKATTGPPSSSSIDSSITKVLGSIWNTHTDELTFNFSELSELAKNLPTTKRSLLKIGAKIFDPLGLLSPFTIKWKVLFQQLCKDLTNWDDALSNDHLRKWRSMTADLETLNNVNVQRSYFHSTFQLRSIQLHCFSDASERAYAAVIYLLSTYEDGHIDVRLVASKSKVAPLKKQSIPRLELLGAVILTRLENTVTTALQQVHGSFMLETIHWVDSQTVLCWIKHHKPWKQYVLTRVNEIRQTTSPDSWRFCPGERNPADIPSRGMSAGDLVDERRWWKGPEFLYSPKTEWPPLTITSDETKIAIEELVKNPSTITHVLSSNTAAQPTCLQQIVDASRYSKLSKLLRTTAYVLRFTRMNKSNEIELTADEIDNARELWIKSIQYESFTKEIDYLKSSRFNSSKPALVRQFNLWLDNKGNLRCKGRLQNSNLSQEEKEPLLLPTKHHVVNLIIQDVHNQMLHSGVNTTLVTLREQYWILRGRQAVKKVIRHCAICNKLEARPFPLPLTPSLPYARVSDEPPFTHTGVDFAGPLYFATEGNTKHDVNKAYICLFTCASTRAVHLELTSSLTKDSFLLAFRRFTSRRGLPVTLMSDNAKTFTSASKEITKITRSQEVLDVLTTKGITWKFIIAKAAWWGGFWERMVQTVKRTLRKVIGRSCLTYEQLATLLTEVECVVNARPLSYVYDDVEGVSYALCPSHLINGRRIQHTPNSSHFEAVSTQESLTRRASHRKRLLTHFTNTWKKDYLLNLREAHAYNSRRSNKSLTIEVGDVVLVESESTKRVMWPLAIVTELVAGRDGKVRAAVLRVAKTGRTIKRSVNHLYPIEVTSNKDS